jgi:uncharacterized membrane protein
MGREDGIVVGIGVALSVVGVAAWQLFSPSPHGYLELFIALPIVLVGLMTTGCGLTRRSLPLAVRLVGFGLIFAAGIPVIPLLAVLAL